jgi:hypothetical protein
LRSAQHYNDYFAARTILLVPNIPVGSEKNVEPGPLRFGQQVAVSQPVPSSVPRFDDRVADQIRKQRGRYAMVKRE